MRKWLEATTALSPALHTNQRFMAEPHDTNAFFAEITERRIRRGTFRSVTELENAVIRLHPYPEQESKASFAWTIRASAILKKIRRTSIATSEAGH